MFGLLKSVHAAAGRYPARTASGDLALGLALLPVEGLVYCLPVVEFSADLGLPAGGVSSLILLGRTVALLVVAALEPALGPRLTPSARRMGAAVAVLITGLAVLALAAASRGGVFAWLLPALAGAVGAPAYWAWDARAQADPGTRSPWRAVRVALGVFGGFVGLAFVLRAGGVVWGWRPVLMLVGAACMLVSPVVLIAGRGPARRAAEHVQESASARSVFGVLACSFAAGWVLAGMDLFVPKLFASLGFADLGVLSLAATLAGMFLVLAVAWVDERVGGGRAVLAVGTGLTLCGWGLALVTIVIAPATGAWVLVAARVLHEWGTSVQGTFGGEFAGGFGRAAAAKNCGSLLAAAANLLLWARFGWGGISVSALVIVTVALVVLVGTSRSR